MRSTLLILSISTLALSTPLSPHIKRQDNAWSFTVYQSLQQCTGAADNYSGNESQNCTTGIRNGSFGSFIVGNVREGCSVGLYDTSTCDPDTLVSVLTQETELTCQQGAEETVNIPAFDVVCD